MKTRVLLTIGAATVAAIAINVNAGNALLSPRSAGNQLKAAPVGVAGHKSATANQVTMVSPRALGNQTTTGATAANDVNPAAQCARTMAGSPKAIQACTVNANMPECAASVQAGCMMR